MSLLNYIDEPWGKRKYTNNTNSAGPEQVPEGAVCFNVELGCLARFNGDDWEEIILNERTSDYRLRPTYEVDYERAMRVITSL